MQDITKKTDRINKLKMNRKKKNYIITLLSFEILII